MTAEQSCLPSEEKTESSRAVSVCQRAGDVKGVSELFGVETHTHSHKNQRFFSWQRDAVNLI